MIIAIIYKKKKNPRDGTFLKRRPTDFILVIDHGLLVQSNCKKIVRFHIVLDSYFYRT